MLQHVDREAVLNELCALQIAWKSAGSEDGEELWLKMKRSIKRLRAMFPDDLELATGVDTHTLREIESLLGEIESIYGMAGRVDFPPDERQSKILSRLQAEKRLDYVFGLLSESKVAHARHALDFRSVDWFGEQYTFSQNQAACVKLLWEAWENGTPEVGGQTILEDADVSSCRLDLVFRNHSSPHPAWGKMIVSGKTKGAYRLQEPAVSKKSSLGAKTRG